MGAFTGKNEAEIAQRFAKVVDVLSQAASNQLIADLDLLAWLKGA